MAHEYTCLWSNSFYDKCSVHMGGTGCWCLDTCTPAAARNPAGRHVASHAAPEWAPPGSPHEAPQVLVILESPIIESLHDL